MQNLSGKVALVTGASRGVGKGIVLGLAESGATIYFTGRTLREDEAAVKLPGTLQQTADEASALGGRVTAVHCDHTDDSQVSALFQRIRDEQGRLDILVNNVWGGYEHFNDGTEFWKETGFWTQPISRWDKSFQAGVRAHYIASLLAAPLMIAQGSGLIVNISNIPAETDALTYILAKEADNRMAAVMARDLREHQVAVLALIPGLVRTEGVLKAAEFFDLTHSESPQFAGRVIAALAADLQIMEKSGQTLRIAALGEEYSIQD